MTQIECGFKDAVGRFDPGKLSLVGPTILVNLGFDQNWKPGGAAPSAGAVNLPALIDTGAQYSHIDSALAAKLGLPIIDKCRVSGSSGPHEVDVYLAQMHVPGLNFTQYGAFAGAELSKGMAEHLLLIGRTFLTQFKPIYDGVAGRVILAR